MRRSHQTTKLRFPAELIEHVYQRMEAAGRVGYWIGADEVATELLAPKYPYAQILDAVGYTRYDDFVAAVRRRLNTLCDRGVLRRRERALQTNFRHSDGTGGMAHAYLLTQKASA